MVTCGRGWGAYRRRNRLALGALTYVPRRFKPPWTVERIPGGYVVKDATGQSLAYVYARETRADADTR